MFRGRVNAATLFVLPLRTCYRSRHSKYKEEQQSRIGMRFYKYKGGRAMIIDDEYRRNFGSLAIII